VLHSETENIDSKEIYNAFWAFNRSHTTVNSLYLVVTSLKTFNIK